MRLVTLVYTVFPSVSVYACRFHLGQASIWRHIHCLGFTDEYNSSCSEIGRWLHLFHGLAFLHAPWWCCRHLCVWHHGLCTDIWQNWQICWLLFDIAITMFPSSLWAQIPSDLHRTNNEPESFHIHFYCQFISPRATFYTFWAFGVLLFGRKL